MIKLSFPRKKKAFTMTEVLIATSILAALISGLYTLFSHTVKNIDIGDWKVRTQTKLRTAAKQLHKDICGATYPATIKLNDIIVEKEAKWNLKFKSGNTTVKNSSDTLLEFYICTPGRDISDDKSPQKIIKCTLKADNGSERAKLIYEKKIEKGEAAPLDDLKKTVLVEDIVYFDARSIKVEDATSYDPADRVKNILRIEMQCAHARHPQTRITEHIEVPLLVKINSEDPASRGRTSN